MSETLAVTRVAASDNPSRALVMLHGIYGRGRNWQAIARGIIAARPDYACWLVDLPHHGGSPGSRYGDTVVGLANDVRDWLQSHAITADGVLGHSYGGKVALAMAMQDHQAPLQIWVIDSTPEVKAPSGSAWGMLALVRRLPQHFATRDEATQEIVNGGYSLSVARWMATNLVREGDGFVWRLDFDVMERLLIDFFNTDLWSIVESPGDRQEIHFLKASESNAITPQAVERLESMHSGRVHLHHRPGGHWIHAESPDVVTQLLLEYLPR
jgi:pimeloyl-ACP methyl ester carboxylesterase